MPRSSTAPRYENVAQLLEQLGDIDPVRIRLDSRPGKATERHLLALASRTDRLFELVDGVLVEKVLGYLEGSLASWLSHLLQTFLDANNLGNLAGSDAMMRLMPGLVRLPDLSFVRWERLPVHGQIPTEPIPDLVPDLAIEVLSKSNRPGEMARKLKDHFLAGVTLVWFVDPRSRTVQVFTAPDQSGTLEEDETLDGGEVLPGLQLPVQCIFVNVPPM